MHVYPIAGAVVWGIVTGLFALPRAAHRLAVEPESPWRAVAPDGRRYPPGVRGWLGRGPGCGALAGFCGLVSAALAAVVGPRPELAVWLLLAPVGVLLARVDLAVHRLPDVLTLPAGAAAAALLGPVALLPDHGGSWPRALLGAVVLTACYFLLFLASPGGMGPGDVKLAPVAGLVLGWYGWPVLFAGTFAGFALGAVAGLVLLATGRADRRTPIPFGPFMLTGALGGVLLAAG